MDRFEGRVAVVTGASAGIGAGISEDLARAGMQVVGLARRLKDMQDLAEKLTREGAKGRLHPMQCDVSVESEILRAFKWVEDNLGGVSVLVNNAGAFNFSFLQDLADGEIPRMVDLNVGGFMSCSRSALLSMRNHAIKDGHIININSVMGHTVHRSDTASMSIYSGSKYAMRAFSKGLRNDIKAMKAFRIRVTNLSPGSTDTDIVPKAYREMLKSIPGGILSVKAVSNAVMYALSVPAEVEITELTIQPVGQIF